ncbi:hypothetical protein, partial [Streptococcus pneumoniae]|uniref:hypothetical protein n=1 Tax=Streptococcus pneumoniae TaxID=1313 RepID=UPI0018B0B89B
PSGQEIINGTIGAFLLGGLLGLKDNGVISGARAEGLKFAAENPEQMRRIIDDLPFANEADREMYHEQMGKLVKTYK